MRRFQRSVLLFLLAWLPVQAMAGPLLVLCCDHPAAVAAATADTPCHGHEPADESGLPGDDGQSGDHANPGHLCCPHFSAIPAQRLGIPAASARVDAPVCQTCERSHYPEQPQRPPRA